MFQINEDLSIDITRGDIARFDVIAFKDDTPYIFKPGEVVRINIYEKKNAEKVVIKKDFEVNSEIDRVKIYLSESETTVGEIISKPVEYWYEVVLNPLTAPQTIIGYDDEGPKIFKIYPEGDGAKQIMPEDIPIVDKEFSKTSDRPLSNYVITAKFEEQDRRLSSLSETISTNNIKPITRKEFEEKYALGTLKSNTVYAILDEEDAYDVAKEALSQVQSKANKILEGTEDNLVSIDNHSEPKDSGIKTSDILPLIGNSRVQLLSYDGTGTTGAENPTELKFNFAPKIVIYVANIQKSSGNSGDFLSFKYPLLIADKLTETFDFYDFGANTGERVFAKKIKDGKNILMYGDTASEQLNNSGYTYYILGVG